MNLLVSYINVDGCSREQQDKMLSYYVERLDQMKDDFNNKHNEYMEYLIFAVKEQPTKIEWLTPKPNNQNVSTDILVELYEMILDSKLNDVSKDNLNSFIRQIKIKKLLKN